MRCINLDWLEVFAIEKGSEKNAAFFSSLGFDIKQRAYGTPQYREMFTISQNGTRFMEVRRNPYSLREVGGIFPRGACHLRLPNMMCYGLSPAGLMLKFLNAFSYELQSLSRVDVCLDFQTFDDGSSPEQMIGRLMSAQISKLNQPNIAAHGKSMWHTNYWNSLKWGANTSAITTKLYNKSLELKEGAPKVYIQDHWAQAGMITPPDVWRIEFSLDSIIKNIVKLDTGENFEVSLSNLQTREQCWDLFVRLYSKYFDFRQITYSRNGNPIRKYRCPRLQLIDTKSQDIYTPVRIVLKPDPSRTDKMLIKRLQHISQDDNYTRSEQEQASIMHFIMKSHFPNG